MEHAALIEAIVKAISPTMDAVDVVFDLEGWAEHVASLQPYELVGAAPHLLAIMHPAGAPADFWATDLGQEFVRLDTFLGNPTPLEASAILRVTPQRVYQLIGEGKLSRPLTRDSVMRRWHANSGRSFRD
jgi:hypothetical protein